MLRIDASWLDWGFLTTDDDGYYAEFYPDGRLAHFGLYEDGICRVGLYLEDGIDAGRAEQLDVNVFPMEAEEADFGGEGGQQFGEWVRGWIDAIYNHTSSRSLRCSFCDRTSEQVEKLIAGSRGYICNGCVVLCSQILAEEAVRESKQGDGS